MVSCLLKCKTYLSAVEGLKMLCSKKQEAEVYCSKKRKLFFESLINLSKMKVSSFFRHIYYTNTNIYAINSFSLPLYASLISASGKMAKPIFYGILSL